ncbi:Cytochrome c oxidase, subunit VIb [Corchorus capsularis]|uniref:Cytochrome c oxidase, subunit VIb n=1 Tax=Corchorus capsularis TaxID=210143 RepID=A0A1R3GUP6_COCAP|nr:Cytochrome c oxidase, subunit VIb [Corchorus capsularis]
MALETYASGKRDEVHTDVLFKARQACYKSRDEFYACLDKQSDKKPTEMGFAGLLYPVECQSSRNEFVKNCRTSWVKHFDRQYCKTKSLKRLLDDKESRRAV